MNRMPDKSVSLEGTCFDSRVQSLSDWLIDQAFGDPDVVEVFVGLCERLRELGIRIDRANLAWPTLHPLFQAESVTWDPESSAVLETHAHGTIPSGDGTNSPLRVVVQSNLDSLPRRPDGPETQTQLPAPATPPPSGRPADRAHPPRAGAAGDGSPIGREPGTPPAGAGGAIWRHVPREPENGCGLLRGAILSCGLGRVLPPELRRCQRH